MKKIEKQKRALENSRQTVIYGQGPHFHIL